MEKRINKKLIATILAFVLVLGSIAGGTLAWLIAESEEVVNTFTYGDINIDLEETDTELDDDDDDHTNEYEMMPGQEITKDPWVTVKEGSEANWLFVKLEKSENFDEFLTYTIADGWAQLLDEQGAAVEGVYYRFQAEIPENGDDVADDAVYTVLKDNKVTVLETVTKEQLNALDPENQDAAYPTLTVSAYAVQYVGFEAEVSEGATEATDEQVNAAALKAWNAALAQQAANEAATEPATEAPIAP